MIDWYSQVYETNIKRHGCLLGTIFIHRITPNSVLPPLISNDVWQKFYEICKEVFVCLSLSNIYNSIVNCKVQKYKQFSKYCVCFHLTTFMNVLLKSIDPYFYFVVVSWKIVSKIGLNVSFHLSSINIAGLANSASNTIHGGKVQFHPSVVKYTINKCSCSFIWLGKDLIV